MFFFNWRKRTNDIDENNNLNSNSNSNSNSNKKLKDNEINNLNNLLDNLNSNDISSNAIIYTRCSSKRQNEDKLHGHATQLEICKQYAIENNLNIVDIYQDTCNGHDISKLTLNNILNNIPINNFTNIIVADPSRISRSPAEGTTFVMKCLNKKIFCHSVRHNISTSNTNERKQFTSYFHDAYEESEMLKMRIKSNIKILKRYKANFGLAPFGYTNSKIFIQNAPFPIPRWTANIDEQKIIKLISMMYYGCKLNELYELLRELSSDDNARLYYIDKNTQKKVEFNKKIDYGEICSNDIAEILNDYNIKKRGKDWNSKMILYIINNNQNNENNENNKNIKNNKNNENDEDDENDEYDDYDEDYKIIRNKNK